MFRDRDHLRDWEVPPAEKLPDRPGLSLLHGPADRYEAVLRSSGDNPIHRQRGIKISAIDFKKLLGREALDQLAFHDERYRKHRDEARALTDENLAATIQLFVANMQMPYIQVREVEHVLRHRVLLRTAARAAQASPHADARARRYATSERRGDMNIDIISLLNGITWGILTGICGHNAAKDWLAWVLITVGVGSFCLGRLTAN